MTDDDAAFKVHLAAFDRLCELYMTVKSQCDEEAIIIDERIKGYRRGCVLPCSSLEFRATDTDTGGKSYMRTAVAKTHYRTDELSPNAPHLLHHEQLQPLNSKLLSRR